MWRVWCNLYYYNYFVSVTQIKRITQILYSCIWLFFIFLCFLHLYVARKYSVSQSTHPPRSCHVDPPITSLTISHPVRWLWFLGVHTRASKAYTITSHKIVHLAREWIQTSRDVWEWSSFYRLRHTRDTYKRAVWGWNPVRAGKNNVANDKSESE